MAQAHYKRRLGKVLSGFLAETDPVLALLQRVPHVVMQIEAEKGEYSKNRTTYFSGGKNRRMDTQVGTV